MKRIFYVLGFASLALIAWLFFELATFSSHMESHLNTGAYIRFDSTSALNTPVALSFSLPKGHYVVATRKENGLMTSRSVTSEEMKSSGVKVGIELYNEKRDLIEKISDDVFFPGGITGTIFMPVETSKGEDSQLVTGTLKVQLIEKVPTDSSFLIGVQGYK